MIPFVVWADNARLERERAYDKIYGKIKPKLDKRNFLFEAIEELLDALNYLNWAQLKGELTLKEWEHIEMHVKIALSYIPNGKRLYYKSRKTD